MPWYRTIIPKNELKTLAKRQQLDYADMHKQQPYCSHQQPSHFTELSAFHYITKGVKQRLFTSYDSDENIGIILRPYTQPRNVYWRDSNRCALSNATFKVKHTPDSFQTSLTDNQFILTTEDKAAESVRTRYRRFVKQYQQEDLDPQEASVPWTEGLFRYQRDEIDGIVVNPKNTQSCLQAYAFAKTLEAHTKQRYTFYACDGNTSALTEVDRDTVKGKIYSSSKQLTELLKEYHRCHSTTQEKHYG